MQRLQFSRWIQASKTSTAVLRPFISKRIRLLATVASRNYTNVTLTCDPSWTTVNFNYSEGDMTRKCNILVEWLRDNCKCPKCIHPSNRQKLHSSADVVGTVVERAEVQGKDVHIVFKLGDTIHETTYDVNFLLEHDSEIRMALKHQIPIEVNFWKGGQMAENIKFIDYHSYMKDEASLYEVLVNLHRYGLAFLENCPTENKGMGLADIAERIAPIKHTFYGRLWDVRSIPDAKNIAYTSLDLGLHMDLLYFADPPGLQFLQCLANEAKGGASYFCDSFYAADKLRRENGMLFATLCNIPVSFHYDHKDHQMFHRHPTIVLQDIPNGEPRPNFSHVNYSPPFQAPLELYTKRDRLENFFPVKKEYRSDLAIKTKAMQRFYEAFTKFAQHVNDKEGQFELTLKPGQCVIFNNRRVLHARREFDASSGERWLKGAYIDQDAWRDRLKVMHRQREDKRQA